MNGMTANDSETSTPPSAVDDAEGPERMYDDRGHEHGSRCVVYPAVAEPLFGHQIRSTIAVIRSWWKKHHGV